MNGENRFSIRDVIKTAWHNIKGTKWAIWAPQIAVFLIYVGAAALFGIVSALTDILPKPGMGGISIGFFIGIIIFEIVIIFLVSPLVAGIQMVALKRVRGDAVKASTGFKYWHKWIPLGFTALLFTIGAWILNQVLYFFVLKLSLGIPALLGLFSLILALIVLLYLAFFIFNLLFVADKGKGPWGALGHSAKMVAPHWFRVSILLIYFGLIAVVAVLPAVLGMLCPVDWVKVLGVVVSIFLYIWAIPYINLMLATIFHRLSDKEKSQLGEKHEYNQPV